MICSQCGNSLAEGAAACPQCGKPVSAGPSAARAPQAFAFDAARWGQAERVTGVATLVLLISLFLPWFTVSVSSSLLGGHTVASASGSGVDAHGYLWLVFIVSLAVIAFLVLQAGFATLPFQLPAPPQLLLLGATGLNLLLVLVAFFFKPGTGSLLGSGISVSWAFGAFISLLAAIAACVPLGLPLARARVAAS
jgi:zinc ribbon protein